MLRTLVVVCLTVGAALAADEGLVAVPTDGYVPRPGPAQYEPAPPARAPVPGSPNALWLQFDRMTAAERKNAELSLQPSSAALPGAWDESREICRLWNRGEYDAAINRLQGYYRFDDPCRVTVAVNWRTPIAAPARLDGPDVRIGTYDSIDDLMLDRGANGYLYAGMPLQDSTRTRLMFYRSTDNGSSWQGTSSVYWGTNNFLSAWSAACHGDYYQVSWTTLDFPHRAWAGRKSMTTGGWIRFPGDSLAVLAIAAPTGDTIEELAEASTEDWAPGNRIYLFGRTENRNLYFSWTDSSCRGWRPHSTGVTTCDNGLDCTMNENFSERYLWLSWLRNMSTDTTRLAFGWLTTADTLFHWSWFAGSHYARQLPFEPTSITAWRDTVMMTFTTWDNPGQVRGIYSYDAGAGTWYVTALAVDSTYTRELPEVSMRNGGGLVAAYRAYAPSANRWVFATHADTVGGTLAPVDTVNDSDHRPSPTGRIRIVPLGGGSYGVGWINWTDSVRYGAWFSTYALTGVAESPAQPKRPAAAFRVTPSVARGPVRVSWDGSATRLVVTDVTGRIVRSITAPKGNSFIWDGKAPAGTYLVCLTTNSGTSALPVVIQ